MQGGEAGCEGGDVCTCMHNSVRTCGIRACAYKIMYIIIMYNREAAFYSTSMYPNHRHRLHGLLTL